MMKAQISRDDNPLLFLPCMFNPTQYQLSMSVNAFPKDDKGRHMELIDRPLRALSVELVFDTYELGVPVTLFTNMLWMWARGSFKLGPTGTPKREPILVRFGWGLDTSFPAVISNIKEDRILFSSGGSPLRAKVSLTLSEAPPPPTLSALAAEAVEAAIEVALEPGMTIAAVAAAQFGNAAAWRNIATDNPAMAEMQMRSVGGGASLTLKLGG